MATATDKDQGQLAYPYGRTSSDEEILAGVLNALHHNTGVPQERVRVDVRYGRAVLTGALDQKFERSLAEQAAATAPGVIEVDNQITITH